jgi:hypothetical protein
LAVEKIETEEDEGGGGNKIVSHSKPEYPSGQTHFSNPIVGSNMVVEPGATHAEMLQLEPVHKRLHRHELGPVADP